MRYEVLFCFGDYTVSFIAISSQNRQHIKELLMEEKKKEKNNGYVGEGGKSK